MELRHTQMRGVKRKKKLPGKRKASNRNSIRQRKIKLTASLIFTIPLFYISMGHEVKPPELEPSDPRCPFVQEMYQNVPTNELPLSESLEDTVARVIPYYEKHIKPRIRSGETILIAAHGNSIRALIKYLEHLSEDEIMEINVPTGAPLVYEFNRNGKIKNRK